MKKTIILSLTTMVFASLLGAQADMEQRPADLSPEGITAKPEGGFSKSVGGKWKCGKHGTLTLTDTNGKVKGTYTTNRGTVTGTVKGTTFTGDWKEANGKKGYFKLEASIRRMTTKPTHLEGTKTAAAKGAKDEPFSCQK